MFINRSLLLLIAVAAAPAATITVCSSGCSQTTMQAAMDAVTADGDIIEVTAGQTVTGGEFAKPLKNITIRSSRWRELPAMGVRIDETRDAAAVATVTSLSTGDPAIRIGRKRIFVGAVNTTTDVLTWQFESSRHLPVNGDQIACGVLMTGDMSTAALPAPLVRAVRYYVRDVSALTFKLAATLGGDAIDITSAGSAGGTGAGFYSQPTCKVISEPSNIMIRGVLAKAATTGPSGIAIGDVGATTLGDGPQNVFIDHVMVQGTPLACNGLTFGVLLWGGSNLTLRDSQIRNICTSDGNENKAVSIATAKGVLVENNELEAGSIPVLTGGGEFIVRANVANITVRGNLIWRRGNMKYTEGSGVPTRACYYEGGSGEFYRRTSQSPNTCANGACYRCNSDGTTWSSTADEAQYRATRNSLKNLLELKECNNCVIEGNYLVGSFRSADSGQLWAYGISTIYSETIAGGSGPWVQNLNVAFRNNYSRRTYGGVNIVNSGDAYLNPGTLWTQVPNYGIVLQNNVLTDLAQPELEEIASGNTFSIQTAAGLQGSRIENNTIRGSTRYGTIWTNGSAAAFGASNGKNNTSLLRNNLMQAGFDAVSPTTHFAELSSTLGYLQITNCTQWGSAFGAPLTNNALYIDPSTINGPMNFFSGDCGPYVTNLVHSSTSPSWTSTTNLRLQAGSPYSAQNGSATVISTNGADLGADVDAVEQYGTYAVAGVGNAATQMAMLIVNQPGGGIAIQTKTGLTCTKKAYTAPRRFVADEVALGSVSGRYWYGVTCGSLVAVGAGVR